MPAVTGQRVPCCLIFFRNLQPVVQTAVSVQSKNRLDRFFEIQQQKATYWCWAAVAASVADYYSLEQQPEERHPLDQSP